MEKPERDDNPYLPPQVCDSNFDEATANEPGRVPSGFSIKFAVFAVACNLMFGYVAELVRALPLTLNTWYSSELQR